MPRRRAQHPREGACTSVCGAFAHPRVLASIRDVKSRHMRLQRIARLVLKPCEWLTLHYAAANIPIIGALTTLTEVRSLTNVRSHRVQAPAPPAPKCATTHAAHRP